MNHQALHAALKQVRETVARAWRERVTARSGRAQSYDFRTDPILREALAYWEAKRGTRPMPRRRDIDPSELPRHLLPQLQLIDVVEDGRRFYFRLVGTAIVEAFGAEFTGKYVEEVIPPDSIEFILACYRMIVAVRRPVFIRSRYLTSKATDLTANRLLMPLSEDGAQVNMILGVLTFEPIGRRGGEQQGPLDMASAHIDVVP